MAQKIKMRTFLSLHIHSCFASVSSRDVWLVKEITHDKKLVKELRAKFGKENIIVAINKGFTKIYITPDKHFYNIALHMKKTLGQDFSKTPEFQKRIEEYIEDGWQYEPEDLKQAFKEHYETEDRKYHSRRKKQGFLLTEGHENYKGGFSDNIYLQHNLQEYIKEGGCFGYIGHSVRKKMLDRYIEKRFMALRPKDASIDKAKMPKILATWLTSTDGRHFGDSLEGYKLAEQKPKVDAHIREIFNLGFLFSRIEHEGTWASTNALREKYASILF